MTRAGLSGFAVDLGGTKTTAARIERGRICDRATVPTDRNGGLPEQLASIEALLRKVGHSAGARLGVAVTGLVSRSGLWSAVNATTFPNIRSAPLLQQL